MKGDLLPIEGVEINFNNLSKGEEMFENYGFGEDISISQNMLETIVNLLPNCALKEELERKLALHKSDNSIEEFLAEQSRLNNLLINEYYESGASALIENFAMDNIEFDIGDMGLNFEFDAVTDSIDLDANHEQQFFGLKTLSEKQKKFTRKGDRRLLKRLPWNAEDKENVFAEIGSAQIPKMPDIKALRKREGLSQSDFARIYAINLANIRAWERGKEASPMACAYMRLIELWPNLVREMLGLQV